MKRILCYGDSNTWGYIPLTAARYEPDIRWTGVLQRELGPDYCVVEEGLNGRTSAYDDMRDFWRNGREFLPVCLVSQKPLDLLIISLGTNDLKFTDALGAAKGVESLICLADMVQNKRESSPVFPNGMKVLVISPIRIGEGIRDNPDTILPRGPEMSRQFPEYFSRMCRAQGVACLDASLFAEPSEKDFAHMEPEGHRALGLAVAQKVREILG